jgi:hypothetical protein
MVYRQDQSLPPDSSQVFRETLFVFGIKVIGPISSCHDVANVGDRSHMSSKYNFYVHVVIIESSRNNQPPQKVGKGS